MIQRVKRVLFGTVFLGVCALPGCLGDLANILDRPPADHCLISFDGHDVTLPCSWVE